VAAGAWPWGCGHESRSAVEVWELLTGAARSISSSRSARSLASLSALRGFLFPPKKEGEGGARLVRWSGAGSSGGSPQQDGRKVRGPCSSHPFLFGDAARAYHY
jgi:hypothetical protein